MWRQQLPQVRMVVSSYFLLGAAKRRKVDLDELKEHNYQDLGGVQEYKDLLLDTQSKMKQWDNTIQMLEPVVHAVAVMKAAEKEGIMVRALAEDPLSLYRERYCKMADASVQVDEECPFCTSFVVGVEEVSHYCVECFRCSLLEQQCIKNFPFRYQHDDPMANTSEENQQGDQVKSFPESVADGTELEGSVPGTREDCESKSVEGVMKSDASQELF